jgi:hypothetical protein
MSKIFADSHKTFVRLVGLNIAFDILSIPAWIALSFTASPLSTSTLTVNTSIAIVDAAVAAAVFAMALFGILGRQKWAAYLAVAATVAQRVTGVFIFDLNVGMVVEVVWSLLIIYFAFKTTHQTLPLLPTPEQKDRV